MFNTTVHGGNFHELPALAAFFMRHADVVRTASLQLQADTGRGTALGRAGTINNHTVWAQIERGLGTRLNRNASRAGHPECSGYGMSLICNGKAIDLFHDSIAIGRLQALTARVPFQRHDPRLTISALSYWALRHPLRAGQALGWLARLLAPHWRPLLASRGKLHSLSFITHNFMHTHALDPERLKACVFTTMTAQGPISMCMHNAKRDAFILAPVKLDNGRYWQPLDGSERTRPAKVSALDPNHYGLKRSKGRTRQALLDQRRAPARNPA